MLVAPSQTVQRLEEVSLPTTSISDSHDSNSESSATVGQASHSVNKTAQCRIGATPTDADPQSCDVCSGKSVKVNTRRTHRCVDCDEALCDSCAEVHRNSKMLRDHVLVGLEPFEVVAATALNDVDRGDHGDSCVEHPAEKTLDVFCSTCRVNICRLCRLDRHKRHDCSDNEELVDRLRRQVATVVAASTAAGSGQLQRAIEELKTLIDSVNREKHELMDRASVAERAIADRAERLKRRVDSDQFLLAGRLAVGVQTCSTRLDELKGVISNEIASMRDVIERGVQLSTVGSNAEVACESIALVERVDKLASRVDVVRRSRNRMYTIEVVFEESTLAITEDDDDKEKKNIVGMVNVDFVARAEYEPERTVNPRLVHVVPRTATGNAGYVVGIALLFDQLLVLRCVPHLGIQVYDASTLAFRRDLLISTSSVHPGLDETYGLATCEFNRCAYVSDFKQFSVHRVLNDGNENGLETAPSSWSVALGPTGLHVNHVSHNILVTCRGARRLQEYTSSGTLVHEISLQPDVPSPWYAIELLDGSGGFAVSCGSAVVVVGQDGSALTVVGHRSSKSGGVCSGGTVHFLTGVMQTRKGYVIVANRNNDVIELFHPSNGCALNELILSTGHLSRLRRPWAVCMDESRDRLYIGEYDDGRLLVFDDVVI